MDEVAAGLGDRAGDSEVPVDAGEELGGDERLGDEVGGALVDGLHAGAHVTDAGEHDDGRRVLELLDLAQDGQPVHARHDEVEEHEVDGAAADRLAGFGAVRCGQRPVTGSDEGAAEQGAQAHLVVDDENVSHPLLPLMTCS